MTAIMVHHGGASLSRQRVYVVDVHQPLPQPLIIINNNNDIYIIIVIDDDERLWQWLVNVNYINPLSAQGSPTVVDHDRCHLPRPFHNGNDEENDG